MIPHNRYWLGTSNAPKFQRVSGSTSLGAAPLGKATSCNNSPAMKVPIPWLAFRMNVRAAKKTPSFLRPVLTSACSTRSAIMDPETACMAMIKPRSMVCRVSSMGNRRGSPFSGSQPKSRSTTAAGCSRKATAPRVITARFLPSLRATRGATSRPSTAETTTIAVQ